jgi:hypothetical protein
MRKLLERGRYVAALLREGGPRARARRPLAVGGGPRHFARRAPPKKGAEGAFFGDTLETSSARWVRPPAFPLARVLRRKNSACWMAFPDYPPRSRSRSRPSGYSYLDPSGSPNSVSRRRRRKSETREEEQETNVEG